MKCHVLGTVCTSLFWAQGFAPWRRWKLFQSKDGRKGECCSHADVRRDCRENAPNFYTQIPVEEIRGPSHNKAHAPATLVEQQVKEAAMLGIAPLRCTLVLYIYSIYENVEASRHT